MLGPLYIAPSNVQGPSSKPRYGTGRPGAWRRGSGLCRAAAALPRLCGMQLVAGEWARSAVQGWRRGRVAQRSIHGSTVRLRAPLPPCSGSSRIFRALPPVTGRRRCFGRASSHACQPALRVIVQSTRQVPSAQSAALLVNTAHSLLRRRRRFPSSSTTLRILANEGTHFLTPSCRRTTDQPGAARPASR